MIGCIIVPFWNLFALKPICMQIFKSPGLLEVPLCNSFQLYQLYCLMCKSVCIVVFLVNQGALVMSRSILFCILCICKMSEAVAEPQMADPYCQSGRSYIMYMSILCSNVIGECLSSMSFNMYNHLRHFCTVL